MFAPEHSWPEHIGDEEQLDTLLTRPSQELIAFVKTIQSPLLILGAGGKMGPTLAVLAKTASDSAGHPLTIIAVSRFSDPGLAPQLNRRGIQTVCCDLLDSNSVRTLPDAPSILYLVGQKFGTSQNPSSTWAVNTIVPGRIAERYPGSRIVALSTGNVYPLSQVTAQGSKETDALTPVGEYANAAVGRERLFQFYSSNNQTPIALLRLFYAVELRYGVLVDIARKVLADDPIDLTNGYFNCIWQGDANDRIIRALALAAEPPSIWNLCRPEVLSVRSVAQTFGEYFDRSPQLVGSESSTALLGDSSKLWSRMGLPGVSVEMMQRWIANWVTRGGRHLGKPTHFESRDGNY